MKLDERKINELGAVLCLVGLGILGVLYVGGLIVGTVWVWVHWGALAGVAALALALLGVGVPMVVSALPDPVPPPYPFRPPGFPPPPPPPPPPPVLDHQGHARHRP